MSNAPSTQNKKKEASKLFSSKSFLELSYALIESSKSVSSPDTTNAPDTTNGTDTTDAPDTTNAPDTIDAVKLLETPLEFDFVRGFWINQSWVIQHSPIHMGSASPLYFFPDDSIQTEEIFLTLELKLKLKGDKNVLHFSTPFDRLIHVNGKPITSQEIFNKDFVEFGNTAFYIKFNEKD